MTAEEHAWGSQPATQPLRLDTADRSDEQLNLRMLRFANAELELDRELNEQAIVVGVSPSRRVPFETRDTNAVKREAPNQLRPVESRSKQNDLAVRNNDRRRVKPRPASPAMSRRNARLPQTLRVILSRVATTFSPGARQAGSRS
jgi:hypothetical protein